MWDAELGGGSMHTAGPYYAPVRGSHSRFGPPALPGNWAELEDLRNEVQALRAEVEDLRSLWRYWQPFLNQLYRVTRDMVRWWRAP